MRLPLWISLCLMAGLAGLALFASSCGGGTSKTQMRLMDAIVTYPDLAMLVDGNTVQSSVGYGTASPYTSVSSGSRHIQIEPSGSSSPIIDVTQGLSSGTSTTALAYLDPSNNIKSNFLVDNNSSPPSGDFNIRIINAAPAIGVAGADVYIVPSGTNIAGVSPNVSGLQDNGNSSAYLSLTAGDYDIYFTVPGTKSVLAQSLQIAFSAGQVRTAVALNGQSGGFTVAVLSDAG